MSNRLTVSRTRWPNDPQKRIEAAELQAEFAQIMGGIMGVTPTLLQLESEANSVLAMAEAELDNGPRKAK